MNSGGIGLLVTLLVRAQRQRQRVLAYGLSEHYRQIFELTRLDEAIGIHDTEDEALAAAGGPEGNHERQTNPATSSRRARRHELGEVGLAAERRRRARGRRQHQRRGPAPDLARSRASGRCGRRPTRCGCRPSASRATDLIATWKQRFPEFWPEGNRFYAPLTGIEPGEVALLNMTLPGRMKLSTGVMVLYADEESFTLMTPQGHMFAGWITFSATEVDGETVAQAQVLMRASDPIFELGLTLGGHRQEDRFWQHTLTPLAAHFDHDGRGGHPGRLRRQASASGPSGATSGTAAAIRSTLYTLGAPGRALSSACSSATARLPERATTPSSSARARTGSRPRSRSPGRAARSRVLEGAETIGGGCRSAELTLPGFVHDTCSTVHPLALASPFLRELPLAEHGLELVHPDGAARASARRRHGGDAGALGARRRRAGLGPDARRLPPAVRAAGPRAPTTLVRRAPRPAAPAAPSARCWRASASSALRSAAGLARSRFEGERARALLAGCCAHSMLSLRSAGQRGLRARAGGRARTRSAGPWRAAARSGSPTRSPRTCARSAARIETGRWVESLDELAGAGVVAARRDPAPAAAARRRRAARRLPRGGSARYRYGPGVFKLDWALDGPIPWTAPGGRPGRAPCTSAARSTRSPPSEEAVAARRAPRAPVRAARAAEPLRPDAARRRASTPPGPTATCPTARRAT